MSGFESRGPARSYSHAAPAAAPRARPEPLAPEDRARQAVTFAAREVDAAEQQRVEVVDAHGANDLGAWRIARDKLGGAVKTATQAVEKARALDKGAAPASGAQLEGLEHRLGVVTSSLTSLDDPPKGYVEVALEADLLTAIRRRPEGVARTGFQQKEEAIRGLLARLTPADCRTLATRITKQLPGDALASAFVTASNLGADRQQRLLDFLKGAPRREALRVGRIDAGVGPAMPAAESKPAAEARPAAQGARAPEPAARVPEPTAPVASATAVPGITPAPSALHEDARVATTAAKPQLTQRGQAMQYYRLHQAAFLATVRARMLAANLGTGSPQLAWAQDATRFVDELGFALTGPESSELPELLYPSDPWHLIDAQRGMDADPTSSTGAMGWTPAAGFALASATERSVRASLPRMAARYAATHGTQTASELVASHPMDRVVAVALCAKDVVVRRQGRAPSAASVGHDVQTDGLRLVTSYHWLEDPALWNWIRVEEPADATTEEIALTLWNRTDYAYGLTRISGLVAIPKAWARQLPGARPRERTGSVELERVERSPAEQLAASKLGDAVALTQGATAGAPDAIDAAHPAPVAPDRAQLVDALDATGVILDELRALLAPWTLAHLLDGGRAFVARKRATLADAPPADLAAWSPVLTGQRAIVGEALAGMLQTMALLTEAGVSPAQIPLTDRSHPAVQVLHGYASAAGTAQLGETARATLAEAKASHAMLPVNLVTRAAGDAGREVGRLQQGSKGDAGATTRARELTADHTQLAGEAAALESQVMATGAPDPVLLETAGLDAATLGLRAHVANLRAGLRALSGALDAADQGVLAAIANLSGGARLILTSAHLDTASFALGDVETTLDHSSPAAINAKWDAMPTTPANREYGRQFELRDTRKATLALAQQQFSRIAQNHGLDGALFARAEKELHDAQIRKLVANVAVMLAVGVASGGIATVAGDFAAGFVGAGRAVTTIGRATSALRAARVVGGITNVAVDAGVNASAQTALDGGHLGSSFVENLLSNAAIRAALHPLHAVIRTWGGLDEEAYALWAKQGARWKLALAKTTVVSANLVTAAATGYVTHRLMTLAKGEAPDEQTMASWAIQGATLALAHVINRRLEDAIARMSSAGRRAGDLLGRMRLQQRHAQQVRAKADDDPAAAMQLLVDHQQTIHDEIEFWRKIAADPDAMQALGLDQAKVAARLDSAEAQRADIEGAAFDHLPFRLAGLTQEVAGSRLWVGDADQIAAAIASARAAKLGVEATPPPHDAGQGARIWRIKLNGEPIEVRERAGATRPKTVELGKRRGDGTVQGGHDGPESPHTPEHLPGKQRGPSSAPIVLAGDDAWLRAAAQRVQPLPGYIDVVVHADARRFEVVREHEVIELDHRALATYLEKHGLTGMRIRLIACESGQNPHAVAQDLANKLNVEVLAPTRKAWIDGEGVVGVGERDQHEGRWEPFKPKREPVRGRPSQEPYRESPPLRLPDGSELDPPVHVAVPRIDARAHVRADQVATLSATLGARVVLDETLHNGVEVRATQSRGLLGYDITGVVIHVGPAALTSDVMLHASTVQSLRRYNGVLGKLRLLAERLFQGRGTAKDGKTASSQFRPGTRGYITETELTKLKELIASRKTHYRDGLIDRATLDDEVAFLQGQYAFHEETLQSMADTGHLRDEAVAIGAPDIGVVTRQAQARGYKLPGEAGGSGPGAQANPDHYYYRRAQHDATQFELARKPSAPADAPAYKARTLNGEFKGLEDAGAPVPKEVVPVEQSKQEVVARLRETEGFGPYAEMLEAHGIASRVVIDAAVTTLRGRKNQAGQEVTIDWLRHEVKDHFRDRVMAKLLDSRLDATASYRNMRTMLDGLGNADRGALAEVWYRERNAPTATANVKYQVTRTDGENAGQVETRVADMVVDREAREVKDIEGKIDQEQFHAYVDELTKPEQGGTRAFDKLRYVFTKPQGAIANLKFFADQMAVSELRGRVTVEAFDRQGTKHIATNPTEAFALLKQFKAMQ